MGYSSQASSLDGGSRQTCYTTDAQVQNGGSRTWTQRMGSDLFCLPSLRVLEAVSQVLEFVHVYT